MRDPAGVGSPGLDQPGTGEPPAELDAVIAGPPRGVRPALGVAAALVLLVLVPFGLAVRAGWQPLLDLDRSVSSVLVVPGRGTDVDILRALTVAGLLLARCLVVVPLVVWFAVLRRWQMIGFLVLAGVGVSPLNGVLKLVFDRARPVYDGTIEVGGLSFPSGHSSGAAALAALLVVVGWPVLAGAWRWVWVGLAALGTVVVGYTRIALGAHFLSDVVAGWSVGAAWVLVLAVLFQVWPGQPGALPAHGRSASP